MLRFCSGYPTDLWVAIMFFEPSCADDFPGSEPWLRRGWWSLAPGQCKTVFGPDLADINRFYCFFAEAADGAVWAGTFGRRVPNIRFDLCSGEGTANLPMRTVGFRLLDIGDNDDFTVTLAP